MAPQVPVWALCEWHRLSLSRKRKDRAWWGLAVAQRRPVECPAETEGSPSCAVQEGSPFNVLVWPRAELFLLFNAN